MLSASAFENGYTNSITSSALFFVQPLHFTSVAFISNRVFELGFAGVTGSNYVLQASTNFFNWTSLSTNLAATNPFYMFDTSASNFQRRFYRVLQQ